MSRCPKCKKSPLNGTELICDNDCGTVFCEFCKIEWYEDPKTRKVQIGHAPTCGSDSDYDDESESSDSEEYRDYSNESESKPIEESSKGGSGSESGYVRRADKDDSYSE